MQMPNWKEFIRCVDVLGEDGVEKSTLDDLTLRDLSVKPVVGPTLGENLYLFSTAAEIQKVLKIAQTQPEILQAVRQEGADEIPADQSGTPGFQPKRVNKKSSTCQCRACKAKKDKEDR